MNFGKGDENKRIKFYKEMEEERKKETGKAVDKLINGILEYQEKNDKYLEEKYPNKKNMKNPQEGERGNGEAKKDNDSNKERIGKDGMSENQIELKPGEVDQYGFKFLELSENKTLETKFYSYEYLNYHIEHIFYEGKDDGWKANGVTENKDSNIRKKFETEKEIKDFIDKKLNKRQEQKVEAPILETTEAIRAETKPERTLGSAQPELETQESIEAEQKSTEPEKKTGENEEWTKEDQETLDTLLALIESTKKDLEEIARQKELLKKAEAEIDTTREEPKVPTENKEGKEESPIKNMENLRLEFQKKDKEIQQKNEEYRRICDEQEKTSLIRIRKNLILEWKRKKLLKESQIQYLELMLLSEDFYKEDRKAFPFSYYLADKIKNQTVKNEFTREALMTKKNIKREYISLDFRNSIRNNEEVRDPYNPSDINSIEFWNPHIRENKNIIFNLCGFCIESKNPEEITENRDGIHAIWDSLYNPNAKFKVINPEGKVILDDADFHDAIEAYKEASIKYLEQAEEEFKNIKN